MTGECVTLLVFSLLFDLREKDERSDWKNDGVAGGEAGDSAGLCTGVMRRPLLDVALSEGELTALLCLTLSTAVAVSGRVLYELLSVVDMVSDGMCPQQCNAHGCVALYGLGWRE